MSIDRTHDRAARSWVASANDPKGDFPLQNLPFGCFRRRGTSESFRGGVALGDQVVDLTLIAPRNVSDLARGALHAAAAPNLDALAALGRPSWGALRLALFDLFREGAEGVASLAHALVPTTAVELAVPTTIRDYTDFYTSLDHAANISELLGIDGPSPNFFSLPLAYHGRSSTVVVSGEDVFRPSGQVLSAGGGIEHVPTRKLDYEMELGIFVGPGNRRGVPVSVAEAESHIFGIGLLNDWSARDVQAWEMAPLGPFNAKNFATTISPWIVTLDALAPFRIPARARRAQDAPLLPYLDGPADRAGFDIDVEVWLETPTEPATRLSRSNFRHQYWTAAQLLAHHTTGGCAMRPGDLLGTGTISGPAAEEAGAMMELAANGHKPVVLANGEKRSFLADGDTIELRASCEKAGFARIGFGPCRGTVRASV